MANTFFVQYTRTVQKAKENRHVENILLSFNKIEI